MQIRAPNRTSKKSFLAMARASVTLTMAIMIRHANGYPAAGLAGLLKARIPALTS
jgi:hypothetical protein